MSRDFIRQLKSLQHKQVNPREEWVRENRALLLSQIKNTVGDAAPKSSENFWSLLSFFLPRPMVYNFVRPLAVFLVVALVGTSGYIATVDAAYESIPGEAMYSLKRGTEKAQVAVVSFIGDKQAVTKLHVEFAKRRATETRIIARTNDPAKTEKLAATVADLKNEIATVSSKLDETQSNKSVLSAAVVKEVNQNTQEIKNVLDDVKVNLLISPSTTDPAVAQAVNSAKDLVKDVSVKAVEVMVAQHLDGDTSVSKDDVKKAINNTLDNAVNEVSETKQNVGDIQVIVNTVKNEVKQGGAAAASGTPQIASNSIVTQISAMASQTQQAALQAAVVSAQVSQVVSQAKESLDTGDLSKAVDALKVANQGTKDAEKISDATMETVQKVIPVAQVIKDVNEQPVTSTSSVTNTIANILKTTVPGVVSNTTGSVGVAPIAAPTTSAKTATTAPNATSIKK